jgi:hypothetical protein
MSEVKKIYAALVKVADGLRKEGIAKSKKCTGGAQFRYRGIDDVYSAVSPLLVANNVIIRTASIERMEDTMAGKMRLVRIRVTYEAISAEDGSSMTFEGIGEGCDTSDKAAGKALSYAYKTALFTLFAIPVEGQEDSDAIVHKIDEPFIPEATMRKANALEAEIVNCFSMDDLQAMVKDIMALGLPSDNDTLKRLRKVWSAQKKTIEEQVNNI